MRTIKFYIILLVGIIIVSISIYGHGPKKNTINIVRNLLAKDKLENWGHFLLVDLIMKVVGVCILLMIIVPMIKDIPNIKEQRFSVIEGEVRSVSGYRNMLKIYQSVEIKDINIALYFNDRIREGDLYTIYYLPNSKFGMEAIKNKVS